jgi:branched-chain amino acid transport system permease protein
LTDFLSIVLLGAVVGSIYSLAAFGLVLTFRTSGVFNFAQGAIGTLFAYLFFQLTEGGQVNFVVGRYDQRWHLPVGIALPLVVVVLAPALGLALDRVLFRPLRDAGSVVQIVATIGLLLTFIGVSSVVWGAATTLTPRSIFSTHAYIWGGVRVSVEKLATIAVVLALAAGLIAFLRRSSLGVRMRAVVDRPAVSELMGVDSGRISSYSWAIASAFGALAGILVVPFYRTLDPTTLSFLVIAMTAAAVVGKLESLPLTLAGGFGIAFLQFFAQDRLSSDLARQLQPAIPFAVLFLALLLPRKWPVTGGVTAPRPVIAAVQQSPRARTIRFGVMVGAVLVVTFGLGDLPRHILGPEWQTQIARVPGTAIIFLSLVVLTGYTGQISLGQAALAGFGAFIAAHLIADHSVPFLLAGAIAALATVPLGALLALPAARLPPLFLGFATLAFAAVMDKVAFTSTSFSGGLTGIFFTRSSFLGSQRAYFIFGLVLFGVFALLADNLRRGRTGLGFAAMRDSPVAVASVGTSVARLKFVSFCLSAFIAGVGGVILAGAGRLATPLTWNNLMSLLFVALAVIGGIRTWPGALVGASLFWLLLPILHQPIVQGNYVGKHVFHGQLETLLSSGLLFGLGAIGLASNPNGIVEQTRQGLAEFREKRAARRAASDARVGRDEHAERVHVSGRLRRVVGDEVVVTFTKARYYHRPSCPLTTGKDARKVTAAGLRRLDACPVCEPEPRRPMRSGPTLPS